MCHYFMIEYKNLMAMDDDHEEDSSTIVYELEMAEENEEEHANAIEKKMLDEVTLNRLRKLPEPRVAKSRSGTKSTCIEQFMLLEKNEVKRLKDSPQCDKDFNTHQCKYCKKCYAFP